MAYEQELKEIEQIIAGVAADASPKNPEFLDFSELEAFNQSMLELGRGMVALLAVQLQDSPRTVLSYLLDEIRTREEPLCQECPQLKDRHNKYTDHEFAARPTTTTKEGS